MIPRHRAKLEAIGKHVRGRRHVLGMTVKQLSEASDLSERFIISVEGGKSNLSIESLLGLSEALGIEIADLFPREPSVGSAREADEGAIVSLIGLRGAGKTTLGSLVALELHVPFVELDVRICERAGMNAGEIFDLHGAQYYRRLERETLDEVLAAGPLVLATAGSLVTDHVTFERLLARSTVVWVKARAEDHFARVMAQGDLRPIANRRDAREELEGILRARRALYERAHYTIDTSRLGLDRAREKLTGIVKSALIG